MDEICAILFHTICVRRRPDIDRFALRVVAGVGLIVFDRHDMGMGK